MAAGDVQPSFDDLCRAHRRPLRAYIAGRLRRSGLPAHCLDEVEERAWVSAWEHLAEFDAKRASFLTWVKRFAHFGVLHAARTWRRRRRSSQSLTRGQSETLAAHPLPADDDVATLDPELAAALDQLSDECRAAIWRRAVEGKQIKEIAEELGITRAAVKAALHRALVQLKRRLRSPPEQNAPTGLRMQWSLTSEP